MSNHITNANSTRSTLLTTVRVPDHVASIAKSPGGKHDLSRKVPALTPLKVEEFRECFAGSAASMFAMIRAGRCERAWLNDIDPAIANFWTVVQQQPAALMCELYRLHDQHGIGSQEMFDTVCAMVDSDKPVEAAGGFYVRNHLSRSGANGMSGFNPSYPRDGRGITRHQINYIPQFSAWLQKVRITNLDYSEVLAESGENVMCFLDPPYDVVGKTAYPFGETDLAKLAQLVRTSPHSCLVTVDDSPTNRVFFSDMTPIVRTYASTMGNHHTASELVCANYTAPLFAIHARDIGVMLEPKPVAANSNDNHADEKPKIRHFKDERRKQVRDMFNTVAGEAKNCEWYTPGWLMEHLYGANGNEPFDLDPCSPARGDAAPVRATQHFTVADDGLTQPWHGTVWLNPPYHSLKHWVRKAADAVWCKHMPNAPTKESAERDVPLCETVVALIPVRTHTTYWRNFVSKHARVFFVAGKIGFLKGVDGKGVEVSSRMPEGLAFVVWGTVWVEKRKALRPHLRRSGELALNSFLALAAQELDAGRLHGFWKAFERTTRLAVLLKSGTPEQLASLCERAVRMMNEQNKPGLLHRLLKLAQDWELMSGADIREAALASVEKCDGDRNWHAAVEMTLFAATTHDKAEKAQADALKLRAAGIFERAAEFVAAGSALQAAHFMERAIEIYRRVAGTKDQRERCHRRLLEFQNAINGEMSSRSYPIDLRELIEAARQAVSGKDFFDALWELLTCARSPSVAELRQRVRENAQESPLSQMFSGTVLDRDGKPVSRFSGVDEDADDAQSGIRHKMIELANLQHHICAHGSLKPAIQVIAAEHQIMAHRFETLIVHAPFVPEGREHVFCVAFQRMFEGKLMEAIHLLLPQVENAIRHVLKQHGVVTSKVKQDMTQEDLNLNEMLFGSTGAETEKIFGADLLFDLQSILVDRSGPNLRNTIAHGKAELGDMYSHDALYFCWMILRLCCLPLAQHWNVLAHLDETGELPASQADDLPD